MAGFSPSLPLRKDPKDPGFALNANMLEVVKQNFKNLVLTSPGERIMIPDFGVGMRNFLFATNDTLTHSAIRSKLNEQVEKYMPFVSIRNVNFNVGSDTAEDFNNGLQIIITYQVEPLGLSDALLVEI